VLLMTLQVLIHMYSNKLGVLSVLRMLFVQLPNLLMKIRLELELLFSYYSFTQHKFMCFKCV